jgi:hypothetical protein
VGQGEVLRRQHLSSSKESVESEHSLRWPQHDRTVVLSKSSRTEGYHAGLPERVEKKSIGFLSAWTRLDIIRAIKGNRIDREGVDTLAQGNNALSVFGGQRR